MISQGIAASSSHDSGHNPISQLSKMRDGVVVVVEA